jgi:hypothetical protein
MTAILYPIDRNKKMPLAWAWFTINSSSTIGKIGEKTIRILKLINHKNQRHRRNKRALPRKSVYFVIPSI